MRQVFDGKMLKTVLFFTITSLVYSIHAYTKYWFWKLFSAKDVGDDQEHGDHDDERDHLDADCAVCLSQIFQHEKFRVLPACKHGFHVQCIDTWLKNNPTCPLCRRIITPLPTKLQRRHDDDDDDHCFPSFLLFLLRQSLPRWMENLDPAELTLTICDYLFEF
ncbi:hypothetical protein I3760_01G207700 [Carya illinoinensis]|nr:hypothetical protein I3760_01G207700 [Carya illinoinensis]